MKTSLSQNHFCVLAKWSLLVERAFTVILDSLEQGYSGHRNFQANAYCPDTAVIDEISPPPQPSTSNALACRLQKQHRRIEQAITILKPH